MRLTVSQHSFLRLLSQAAFANPFSEELDRQIVDAHSHSQTKAKALQDVDRLLAELSLQREPANIRLYGTEDHQLLSTALLFRCFNRYIPHFDDHIRAQEADSESNLTLNFAKELNAELSGFLHSADQVDRYISIFFQMRRAWYFFNQKITGASRSVKELRSQLWNNVFSSNMNWYEQYLCHQMESFSTILLGETGTGKSTVASALVRSHYISWDSQKKKFAENFENIAISLNIAGIPETLLESELLGHRKGSFSGAIDHYIGAFGRTGKFGSVFIDDIGEANIATQAKLLRVMQNRKFSPLGSKEEVTFLGRIIAATNKNLSQLMAEGTFREDFYYLISSDAITLPNLRLRFSESQDEQGLLIRHLLNVTFNIENAELACQCETIMTRDVPPEYTWPGNIREFEQRLRRVLLTGSCVPKSPTHARNNFVEKNKFPTPQSAQEVLQTYCRGLYDSLGSYELVARAAGLDRRTVKKYIVD